MSWFADLWVDRRREVREVKVHEWMVNRFWIALIAI